MIKKITLKNIATFTNADGDEIDSLKKINFFYGSNGSGKTTISRVLERCVDHPDCRLDWQNSEIETHVYSEDFVQNNFFQSEIPGVFTLGIEARETEENIIKKKREIEQKEQAIFGLDKSLIAKNLGLKQLKQEFQEECWMHKAKEEGENDFFKYAFSGFRSSKVKFMEEVLQKMQSTKDIDLKTKEYLSEKGIKLFSSNLSKESPISQIDLTQISKCENSAVFSTVIMGKSDVNISALISKLGNIDWVKSGRTFLKESENSCPFCQQSISDLGLKKQFEEYFDESYEEQLSNLTIEQIGYKETTDAIIANIQKLIESKSLFLDSSTLTDKLETIQAQTALNSARISNKLENPSSKISLETLMNNIQEVNDLIEIAQVKIQEHNLMVDNQETEKEVLINQIWKFFLEEISISYSTFTTSKTVLEKAIAGITESNLEKKNRLTLVKNELEQIEEGITSIIPTKNLINKMLKSFGFETFSLEESTRNGFYKVVRGDGSDAKKTLSEGEKTFLTFLYFYQRVQGSNSSSGTTDDKIVVFDDPISSLDSNILFIVSSLIRQLIKNVKDNVGFIKQIFLLTHNVYFHKEVTFKYEGNYISHWLVKTNGKKSSIHFHERNPIQTSYQMLWDDFKTANGMTAQNTMRRILETYFKHYGDINLEDLYELFQGEEKLICKSLISWIHDGSHGLTDDLYITQEDEEIEKCKITFRKIFSLKGHIGHYNMMMKIDPNVEVYA